MNFPLKKIAAIFSLRPRKSRLVAVWVRDPRSGRLVQTWREADDEGSCTGRPRPLSLSTTDGGGLKLAA